MKQNRVRSQHERLVLPWRLTRASTHRDVRKGPGHHLLLQIQFPKHFRPLCPNLPRRPLINISLADGLRVKDSWASAAAPPCEPAGATALSVAVDDDDDDDKKKRRGGGVRSARTVPLLTRHGLWTQQDQYLSEEGQKQKQLQEDR